MYELRLIITRTNFLVFGQRRITGGRRVTIALEHFCCFSTNWAHTDAECGVRLAIDQYASMGGLCKLPSGAGYPVFASLHVAAHGGRYGEGKPPEVEAITPGGLVASASASASTSASASASAKLRPGMVLATVQVRAPAIAHAHPTILFRVAGPEQLTIGPGIS